MRQGRVRRFNFSGHMYHMFWLSMIVSVIAIALIVFKGFRYGIDFTGGIEVTATVDEAGKNVESLEEDLSKVDLHPSVQPLVFEKPRFYMRFGIDKNADMIDQQNDVSNKLKSLYGDKISIEQSTTIGGVMSDENQKRIIWAIVWTCVGIVLYMWTRFTYQYGVSAIVALLHDLLVMTLFIIVLDKEFTIFTITAYLTILGYSINDTIVLFDRIREFKKKKEYANNFELCINDSINSVLSRTIITSLLTFFVVISLYLFSQGDLEDLSFSLMVGIIAGTYSSYYVAAVCLIFFNKFKPIE